MNGHSPQSGAGHETADVTFNRTFWFIPVCMLLLLGYVTVCWFGATSSLKREMSRKQAQSVESGVNNGTAP